MGTIRLQAVTKQFGPRVVLEGVSLELHSGPELLGQLFHDRRAQRRKIDEP